MGDEPEDLDPEALADTLATCMAQLHRVRAHVVRLADGNPGCPDNAALLRTLDRAEALLTSLAASMATRH